MKYFVFLFFPENKIWHFMQIVSLGDNLLEMSKPIFRENKKISVFLSAAFTQRVVKVKHLKLYTGRCWEEKVLYNALLSIQDEMNIFPTCAKCGISLVSAGLVSAIT